MNEIIEFFKEIFMIREPKTKIGLSQFKETDTIVEKPKPEKIQKEVKLSDLMRRSA